MLHLSDIYNWLLIQYYYLRGKHQKVVDGCTKLISSTCNPVDAAVYYVQRGREYCQLGQYQRAIDDFDKFLSMDIGESVLKKIFETTLYAISYSWRAFAYHRLEQYQTAIDDYSNTIKLRPKDAVMYKRRAGAFGSLGDFQKAVDDCTTAININPKFVAAYVMRAAAYRKLQKQDLASDDQKIAEELGYKVS
jgi:tetratricopeptide (TPR) repeat protein